MNRHQIKRGYLAPVLLMLTASGAAGFDHTPKDAENAQRQRSAGFANVNSAQSILIRGDVVKLEDSLQWTGRDAIELPVSLFVTDLLPGNC